MNEELTPSEMRDLAMYADLHTSLNYMEEATPPIVTRLTDALRAAADQIEAMPTRERIEAGLHKWWEAPTDPEQSLGEALADAADYVLKEPALEESA